MLVTAVLCLLPAQAAFGDKTDNQPPAATTTSAPSPTTTSEFGTETEIEIALDDDGNIVPAHATILDTPLK